MVMDMFFILISKGFQNLSDFILLICAVDCSLYLSKDLKIT